MEHTFNTDLELPLPLETVFSFFSDAANLERITPPELHFRIVTQLPIVIARGTVIEYRLRLFGISFNWSSRISEWDPPRQFIDEQGRGPYALWIHTHSFERAPMGTLIRDSVRYRLPLSPISEVAYPIVKRQLVRIFAYRERAVRDALVGKHPS